MSQDKSQDEQIQDIIDDAEPKPVPVKKMTEIDEVIENSEAVFEESIEW